jgi:hypothetical protein
VALAAIVVPLVACGSSTPGAGGPTPKPPARPAGASIIDQVAALSRAPHGSVKSSDGSAELLLPPGSLPAGTALSDIKITKLIPIEASLRFGGRPPLIAYRLEPDGLEFATRPFLRMATNLAPDGRIPWLFTDSRSGVSRLTAVATQVNLENRQVTLTAQLAHFSQIATSEGTFILTLSELQDHVWGEPFEMKVAIARTALVDPVTRKGSDKVEVEPPGTVLFTGLWLPAGLRPTVVEAPPRETGLPSGSTFTVVQTFSCRTSGVTQVEYKAYLRFPEAPAYGTHQSEIQVDSEYRKCQPPMSPISASFNQSEFTTTYSIQVKKVPALGGPNWSGTDCGTTLELPERSTSAVEKEVSFKWSHPHPPCDATTDHAKVVVIARLHALDDPESYWFCSYQGAAPGKGKPCTYFGK